MNSNITLNGKKMISETLVHEYLSEKMDLPEDYGQSTSALWDELMDLSVPTTIHIINTETLLENLGDYGEEILQVFEDASADNIDLEVTID